MDVRRILLFLSTLLFVGAIATAVIFYASGYRYDEEQGLGPKGLLVVKSDPESAQVFINGEEKAVTNESLNLTPGTYDIQIKKEGHMSWQKMLEIKEGEVTEITAHLFKTAPSLSATTFNGAENPVPSRDFTKLAYFVIPNDDTTDTSISPSPTETVTPTPAPEDEDIRGLWVIETVDLPLGFSREPRRVTDISVVDAKITWSPDSREIILVTPNATYELNAQEFTSRNQLVPLTNAQIEDIQEEWDIELAKKREAQLARLPEEFEDIFSESVGAMVFSPDEDMVLYSATSSATLEENVVKQLPGASTQQQTRDIKEGQTYVYDIKEDRNFLIDEDATNLIIQGGMDNPDATKRLTWFATSRNLVLAEENKVTIMDSDGTNRQTVYGGSFVNPHAFPTVSIDRLMILTNLGAQDTPANIYSLSVK